MTHVTVPIYNFAWILYSFIQGIYISKLDINLTLYDCKLSFHIHKMHKTLLLSACRK